MDEYACVTVTSNPDESADEFNKRLISFWSNMLRTPPAEYERIYAETSQFDRDGDRLTRQYLVGVEIAPRLEEELSAAAIAFEPIDLDDLYTKYEAAPPEWFQISH